MKNAFSITNNFDSIELDEARSAQISFNVTNETGRRVEVQLSLQADGKQADWFVIQSGTTRTIAPQETEHVSVAIRIPPLEPAQSVSFNLGAVCVEEPDETFCEGPSAAISVRAPVVKKRKIPWVLITGIFVMLVLALAFTVSHKGQKQGDESKPPEKSPPIMNQSGLLGTWRPTRMEEGGVTVMTASLDPAGLNVVIIISYVDVNGGGAVKNEQFTVPRKDAENRTHDFTRFEFGFQPNVEKIRANAHAERVGVIFTRLSADSLSIRRSWLDNDRVIHSSTTDLAAQRAN